MRVGYETDACFFEDSDITTRVRWYKVPRDRPFLPVPSFLEDANWQNDNGPRPPMLVGEAPGTMQGEVWADRPVNFVDPRPGEAFTGHFCGSEAQWAGALSIGNPEDFGEYGCCVPGAGWTWLGIGKTWNATVNALGVKQILLPKAKTVKAVATGKPNYRFLLRKAKTWPAAYRPLSVYYWRLYKAKTWTLASTAVAKYAPKLSKAKVIVATAYATASYTVVLQKAKIVASATTVLAAYSFRLSKAKTAASATTVLASYSFRLSKAKTSVATASVLASYAWKLPKAKAWALAAVTTPAYSVRLQKAKTWKGAYSVSFVNYGTQTLAATGTTQGTAAAITSDMVKATTSTGNTGIILPATGGLKIEIHNAGPSIGLNVYPPSGGSICTGSVNMPIPVNNSFGTILSSIDGVHWYVVNTAC
jgi:hypothetical protein